MRDDKTQAEQREWGRCLRHYRHDCPRCDYSTHGRRVAPGRHCPKCGWKAPGEPGEDRKRADSYIAQMRRHEQNAAERRREAQVKRGCPVCGKVLKTKAGKQQHMSEAHREGARP